MDSMVKQMSNKKVYSATSCTEAKDGTILMEERILERWEEYVNELFDDSRGEKPYVKNTDGLPILTEKLRSALNKMSREKAAGPDGVCAELIEALDEVGIEQMTNLANEIYDGSKFPAEMCKSIFMGRTAGEIAEEQYGFTPDKGTRNAIFVVRMLTERAIHC